MGLAEAAADIAAAALDPAAFGEPVRLAPGVVVPGIFNPIGQPAGPFIADDIGLVGRVSGQPNPSVTLATADAAALVEGDAVTARGVAYLVVRADPDGTGLTHVHLMPAAAVNPDPLARLR